MITTSISPKENTVTKNRTGLRYSITATTPIKVSAPETREIMPISTTR